MVIISFPLDLYSLDVTGEAGRLSVDGQVEVDRESGRSEVENVGAEIKETVSRHSLCRKFTRAF